MIQATEVPYVPGHTPRPLEGAYDAVRDTVAPGMSMDALAASPALRAGIELYEAGWFWECHEVLEAVWMVCPNPSPERAAVQGIIQLANARLKLRMARKNAALRLVRIAEAHFSEAVNASGALPLGLDARVWRAAAERTQEDAI